MLIRGKYLELRDGTRPLLLFGMPKFSKGFPITGAVETITGHKKTGPYKNYGSPIDDRWWNSFKAKMRGYKKMNMVAMLHFWNGLWFRPKGFPSLIETVWYINNSVTDSLSLFFSEKSLKMQIELMEKCIRFCDSINLEIIITRGWEWHILARDRRATKWVKETGKAINDMGHATFIHSHYPEHANIADGMTVEGDFTNELLKKHGLTDYKKPVIRFMNNPDIYKSGNPHLCDHRFETETVLNLLRNEAFIDLHDRQATGIAYPRWFIQKVMEADLKGHTGILKGYNYNEVKTEMMIYYDRIYHESFVKKGRFADISEIDFDYIAGKKKETPTPAPKPIEDKEKYKKTAPLEIVEPVKEKNRMKFNPLKLIWTLIKRWWHMYDIYVVVAGIIIFRCPLLLGLAITTAWLISVRVIEVLKNRNQKPTKQRMESGEILPGDYYYENEPITVLEKPDHCPGE